MGSSVTTKVIRSIPEIDEIRERWIAWQRHPESDLNYFLSRFQFRPEFRRPHIIVASRDEHPEAILVGRYEELKIRDFKIGPWRILQPRGRLLSFNYSGLLGEPTTESCQAIVQSIRSCMRNGEADLATLNNVRTDSPFYAAINDARGVRTPSDKDSIFEHHSMKLPNTVEEAFKGLSGHHRHKVRNQAKRFLAAYNNQLRVDEFRHPDSIDRMMQEVDLVARKTYQSGMGVGFMNTPEIRHRLLMFSQNDQIRVYVLYAADQPCAFWIGTLYRGIYHVNWIGFDPAYGEHSPGIFLFTKILERLCAEGVSEVDFDYGSENYKQRFGNVHWQEALVYFFASSTKGLELRLLRKQSFLTDKYIRVGLERINLLPKIKRFWRKRLAESSASRANKPVK